MDQKNLALLIIASELNTANRLKILELLNSPKSSSDIEYLLGVSKVETQIADVIGKLMESVVKINA